MKQQHNHNRFEYQHQKLLTQIRDNEKKKPIQQGKVTIGIVGAGLSGLSAADQLINQYFKTNWCEELNIFIVEALDRVGGKCHTVDIKGTPFDLGAQFVGNTQKHTLNLINRFDLTLIPELSKGTKITHLQYQTSTYESNIPNNLSILSLVQLQLLIIKIYRMSKQIPSHDPTQCKSALYWDSLTAQQWLNQNIYTKNIKLMIQSASRILFGCELAQVSFLFYLWFIKQNGGFENLVNVKNGLQEWKIQGGTQQLSLGLKEQLERKAKASNGKINVKFYFEHKVTEITQNNNQDDGDASSIVTITAKSQQKQKEKYFEYITLPCSYVIYASSPWCMKNITFTPKLSTQRRLLQKKSFMGDLTKVVLLYQRPYWRQKGFSGQILTDSLDSPIVSCYDDTKQYQKKKQQENLVEINQPAIIAFVGAAVYRSWRDKDIERFNQTIADKLAELFKVQQMKNPVAVEWEKFDDYLTIGGGPVGVLPPGTLTHIKDLRKPEGRVHFAGTEMATVSIGYMDGAIQSGIRAAKEVIKAKLQGNQQEKEIEMQEMTKKPIPWYQKSIKSGKRWFEWW